MAWRGGEKFFENSDKIGGLHCKTAILCKICINFNGTGYIGSTKSDIAIYNRMW